MFVCVIWFVSESVSDRVSGHMLVCLHASACVNRAMDSSLRNVFYAVPILENDWCRISSSLLFFLFFFLFLFPLSEGEWCESSDLI